MTREQWRAQVLKAWENEFKAAGWSWEAVKMCSLRVDTLDDLRHHLNLMSIVKTADELKQIRDRFDSAKVSNERK